MKRTSCRRRLAIASVLVVTLAACGGGSGGLEVTEAWARTSPAMAEAGAAYMQITNGGGADDALVGVSVDPAVARSAEIHETVMAEADDEATHGSDMGGGMMEMRAVDRLEIPAGETVSLEPGGYHIMLLDLASPLEEGSTVELTLTFENAGELVVTAEVRPTGP